MIMSGPHFRESPDLIRGGRNVTVLGLSGIIPSNGKCHPFLEWFFDFFDVGHNRHEGLNLCYFLDCAKVSSEDFLILENDYKTANSN